MKSLKVRLLALLAVVAMLLMVSGPAMAQEVGEEAVLDTFDIGDEEFAVVVDDIDCDGVPDFEDWDLDNDSILDFEDDWVDTTFLLGCAVGLDVEEVNEDEAEDEGFLPNRFNFDENEDDH